MEKVRLVDQMAEDFAREVLSLHPSQDEWPKVVQAYQAGYKAALETVAQAILLSLSRQQLPHSKRWALREIILNMGESKIKRKKNEQIHDRASSGDHQDITGSTQKTFENKSHPTQMEK